MFEPVLSNPWVRALGAALALVLVGILMYLLSPVLVPLFFAFIVAYVLDPIVDLFEARRVSRSLSIAGLAAIGIALLIAVPLFFVPSLIQQADQLTEAAQQDDSGGESSLSTWFYQTVSFLPLEHILDALDPQLDALEPPDSLEAGEPAAVSQPETVDAPPEQPPADEAEAAPDSPDKGGDEAKSDEVSAPKPPATAMLGEEQLGRLMQVLAQRVRSGALAFLQSHGGQVASGAEAAGAGLAQFFTTVGRGAFGMLLFVGNLALFSFVAAYLLKDYDHIIAAARELVPLGCRDKVCEVSAKIDGQLRGFLRGQMMVCVALGVMYFIGLRLSGVPFAFLIAVFGGVASFVPYLGLALTIGPALLLCIVQHGGIDVHLLGVVMTFVIAQLLEGTVLTPRIVGDQVGLGPVWVILAVLVFGNALGFLGLLLAVPIAASLKVLISEALAYYRASGLFTGDDTA
jgi:predicted PurR-regulated permease PerM